MTREEAIICLQGLLDNPLINKGSYLAQAIEMAIQALSQEPTYYPPCIDCNKKMDEIRCAYDKLKDQEPTVQDKQAESEKYQKAFDDGYANGYAQARFDYEQKPCDDIAQERYKDLCEYFGDTKDILKSREDFKAWLGRIKWHIHKAEELYDKYEYKKEPCDDAKYHEEHGEVIVDKDVWEDAKKALEQEPCKECEVGNPCLYCEHEFKDKRIGQMCKDCTHAGVYGVNSMKCTLRDEIVFNDGRCNGFESKVEPCDDAIRREAVMKKQMLLWDEFGNGHKCVPTKYIEQLPSVNPQYTGNEFFNFDAPMVKKSMESVLSLWCKNG